MVAKIAGLASGALLASVAVWAFNDWRRVSDEDRLEAAIVDHCLPYVTAGLTPFSGMGRPVGVYDDADLNETMKNGANAILYDNRFVAQWGEDNDGVSDLRVCKVDYNYVRADGVGFELDVMALPDWISQTIAVDAGLAAIETPIDEFPSLMSWGEPDAAQYTGLRLYLTAQAGGVSSVIVVDSVEP